MERILEGKRVLIVEEDKNCADSLREVLQDLLGAGQIDEVYDAQSALDAMLSEPPYDLVVMEIVMARNPGAGSKVRENARLMHESVRRTMELEKLPFTDPIRRHGLERERQRFAQLTLNQALLDLDGGIDVLSAYYASIMDRFGQDRSKLGPILLLTTQDFNVPRIYAEADWCIVVGKPAHMEREVYPAIQELLARRTRH